MVICDNIHVDPATGKRTLLGTFSAIHTNTFPATIPLIAVYVSITDCRGKFAARLQIVDVDEEREPVQRVDGQVDCDDPIKIVELNYHLGGVQFPAPGEYRVQFFAAGTLIVERRLLVIGIQPLDESHE